MYMCIFYTCADPEGVGGWTPSLKNHKKSGFLAILIGIPWKSQSYPASIQCWAIIGPPVKHHCVSLAGRWWPSFIAILIPSSSLSSSKNQNKKHQKTLSELDPFWQNFLDPRMLQSSCFCSNYIFTTNCTLKHYSNVNFFNFRNIHFHNTPAQSTQYRGSYMSAHVFWIC